MDLGRQNKILVLAKAFCTGCLPVMNLTGAVLKDTAQTHYNRGYD